MTAKEKAQELYDKIHFALPSYHDEGQQEHVASKECALIAVDEMIEVAYWQSVKDYLNEVKTEIEKLK